MAEEESTQIEEVMSTQGQRNQRMKLRSKMWDHFTPNKGDDGTKNLWEHCNKGCGGQEYADAGTSEQPPQPLPSLALNSQHFTPDKGEEAMQQLPPLPPVLLPPSTHCGSVNKDGGPVRQLDGAETGRATMAPRLRQPPHGVGRQSPSLTPRRGLRSPSAIALFLSKKGNHVRREAAGLPRAPRVSNTISRCNSLGTAGLTLGELRQITNNFSDSQLIGQGAFGKVYKGVLTNGDMIAVKRFASTITGLQDVQYENEAQHLMGLKHRNIVQLLGYCSETEMELVRHNGKLVRVEKLERVLCLEYMPEGSLRDHLSDETSGLEWNTRYKIIEGICYGLHYLHEEWEATPIIHMDLKPANILLDDNMVPKIADFGLSRLFGKEQTRTCTTNCKGTPGYMAPEYLEKGVITKKFDIFSLGVIVIQIITGLKGYPIDETETTSQQYIDLVLNNWRHRPTKAQGHTSQDIDYQQIKKCIQIGLLCVKFDPLKRPTIKQIINMLERSNEEYQNKREETDDLIAAIKETLTHKNRIINLQQKVGVYEIDLSMLIREDKIESGSSADLYRGTYKGHDVAIKYLKCENLSNPLHAEFLQEVLILRGVNHENILQFYGACTKYPNYCIVTEYMPGGNTYDFLHKQNNFLDLHNILRIAIDISKGMDYLHQNNIIHRDLKSANLLLGYDQAVKITEFGVARLGSQVMTAETGTYRWMAPEIINHRPYDHKADVFSFAIVLWELATSKVPYDSMTPLQAALGVRQGLRLVIPASVHPRLAKLIQQCWDENPDVRPTFAEIIMELRDIRRHIQALKGPSS